MTDFSPETAIKTLCKEHLQHCRKPRCFTRCGLIPTWFDVPIEAFEDSCIPDSLQPGHGLKLKLPHNYSSRLIQKPGEPDLICVNFIQEGQIKITCRCTHAEVHHRLVEQLCKEYNKI